MKSNRYDDLTYEELLDELQHVSSGSKDAWELHKALKKYGSGLCWWTLIPPEPPLWLILGLSAIGFMLAGAAIALAICL